MSKIEINKIVNANVYVNGANKLGKAAEIDAPNVKIKMATHEGLGLVGEMEFPAGIEKIESKIKWASLYPDILQQVADPYKNYDLQIRGNMEVYGLAGRLKEVEVTAFMTAMFKNLPLGNYKPRENAGFETDLAVYYCKLRVEGMDILEVDLMNNIWRANGEDVLANFRANIGA